MDIQTVVCLDKGIFIIQQWKEISYEAMKGHGGNLNAYY